MGAFCCCPWGEDLDEYSHASNHMFRHCICVRYFLHQLFSGFGGTFQRIEGRNSSSTVQVATHLTSGTVNTADSSLSETYHLVPRPPPFDGDAGYSRLQRDGLISRRDKAMCHIQDNEHIRRSGSTSDVEHMGGSKKWKNADFEEDSKTGHSEMEKDVASKTYGTGYVLTNIEDEDVCPTCLDEYNPENPKIVTKCSHHFHLSCIYEWMERSDNCPICGKEMQFCESP
ncbi:hypothetical protein HPP92_013093 [Vanilla planifolia]|uniref:RING-type E3 ubiquitin transferase n=1 Tax=Vanilla planifolia TaxID=51239 RepID=A0A835QTB0_VANPL|nr:hypothetical protein HPP92_013557 [Vanilla planifolia]KAG0478374.1 hypothetical protein HPP92_013093 [Vanilla planifolia]